MQNRNAFTGLSELIQYLKMVCKVLKTLHFGLSCGIIGTNGDSAPPPFVAHSEQRDEEDRQQQQGWRDRKDRTPQLNYKLQQPTNIPASSGRVGMDKEKPTTNCVRNQCQISFSPGTNTVLYANYTST